MVFKAPGWRDLKGFFSFAGGAALSFLNPEFHSFEEISS
jgi:hypothetical protein